jgi:hypothetical protein
MTPGTDIRLPDTAEQKASCVLFFDREFPALRAALRALDKNRRGLTEIVILLLLLDLPPLDRQEVFAGICEAMGHRVH